MVSPTDYDTVPPKYDLLKGYLTVVYRSTPMTKTFMNKAMDDFDMPSDGQTRLDILSKIYDDSSRFCADIAENFLKDDNTVVANEVLYDDDAMCEIIMENISEELLNDAVVELGTVNNAPANNVDTTRVEDSSTPIKRKLQDR